MKNILGSQIYFQKKDNLDHVSNQISRLENLKRKVHHQPNRKGQRLEILNKLLNTIFHRKRKWIINQMID